MRILLLTFYYPPDLCAGSFRSDALVKALVEEGGSEIQIDVFTTTPNRYRTHQVDALQKEDSGQVGIWRFPLPKHKSGILDQTRAFATFAFQVLRCSMDKDWDLVVATSSRLMTAALGASIAGWKKTLFYVDVRDLFADTLNDVFRGRALHCAVPLFRRLEHWVLRKAHRVNAVSEGFLPYLRKLETRHQYRSFPNGIDEDFLAANVKSQQRSLDGNPIVLYAGNIGEGQGLHLILPQIAEMCKDQVTFRIIGDGGRRRELLDNLNRKRVRNVEILDALPRRKLIKLYEEADFLFLHLNNYSAFHKVLPSKIFEYAAMDKPIIAGVRGYSERFIRENVPGAVVFSPCDPAGFQHSLLLLLAGPKSIDRSKFRQRFARRAIMRRMAKDILDLGVSSRR